MTSKILIVTPIFFGSGSGAATYYKLLVKEFIQQSFELTIVSDMEKPSDQEELYLEKKVSYYPFFPSRCLRNKRMLFDIFNYAIQNIKYFALLKIIRNAKPDTIILHSSFFNHITTLSVVLDKILKDFPELNVVVDVRDRGLRKSYLKLLNRTNSIIACSESVRNYLISIGLKEEKVHHIPVLQEDIVVDIQKCQLTLERYSLKKQEYFLYAGLIKKNKRVDEILLAYVNYLNKKEYPFKLVLAGLIKDESSEFTNLLSSPGVEYVGNLKREELHCLMKNARLNLNISRIEGLPRTSLEAMALNDNVVLPPCIPEFDKECSEYVFNGDSPEDLARFILSTLKNNQQLNYPLNKHSVSEVIRLYKLLL